MCRRCWDFWDSEVRLQDMIKKDCFGCVPGRKDCQVMTENICETRRCSFYKTKAEYRRGLLGLPPAKKAEEDSGTAKRGRRGRRVRCMETGESFPSFTAAEASLRLPKNSVYAVCRGKQKSVAGLTFIFLE